MIDLSTQYLGLKLRNPLVVSASPLSKEITNLRHMEDCGASAVVLHSLFEEQINIESNELDRFLWDGSDLGAESTTIFPDLGNYNIGPDAYLEHIRQAKQTVSIPVIASLNGVSRGGWVSYAREMQQAGADADRGARKDENAAGGEHGDARQREPHNRDDGQDTPHRQAQAAARAAVRRRS